IGSIGRQSSPACCQAEAFSTDVRGKAVGSLEVRGSLARHDVVLESSAQAGLGATKDLKNAVFRRIVAGPEQSGIVNQDDMALTMTRDRVQLLFQGRFLIAARRARSRV